MFSIFESVILVFPKHNNLRGFFEVIDKEIMQIKNIRRITKIQGNEE